MANYDLLEGLTGVRYGAVDDILYIDFRIRDNKIHNEKDELSGIAFNRYNTVFL
jgi:hypothetical protein